MANLNKVLLMGNLTRAPQSRAVQQTGMPICDMGLAINRRYKTQSGEEREDVVYVELITYGHLADYCAKNLTKGSTIYVEGHLRFESWQDKDTNKNRSRLRGLLRGRSGRTRIARKTESQFRRPQALYRRFECGFG